MTAKDLFKRALRLSGALRPANEPATTQLADVLVIANGMLDTWDADPLMIYTRVIAAYPLTAGKYWYTIGPGGDFDTARPESIEEANIILNTVTPYLRRPVELINGQQWAAIKIQDLPGGAIPLRLYNDGAYPLSQLYLWPGPSLTYALELYTWQLSAKFVATTDTISSPPAYSDAMAYNLGVRVSAEWGTPLRPDVASLANESLAILKAKNLPKPLMSADAAILPRQTAAGSTG